MSTAEQVKAIVSKVLGLGLDKIHGQLCNQNCPQWDSAHHLAIVMTIEDEMDVVFKDDDYAKMTDFAALCALVESKLA